MPTVGDVSYSDIYSESYGVLDGLGVDIEALGAQLIFEVSESSPSADVQVWHDLSGYMHGSSPATVKRGRASQRDEVQAGTLNLTLDATNGDLDPSNFDDSYSDTYTDTYGGSGASPHIGCLRVRRRCRLRLVHAGVTYTLMAGYADGWPRVYDRPNIKALIPFGATDASRIFSNGSPTAGLFRIEDPVYGAIGVGRIGGDTANDQLSGELIGALLDAFAWPASLRDIDPGRVMVSGTNVGDRGLAAMKDAAKAEGGDFYISAAGSVVHRDRIARYTEPRSTVSQVTFYPRPQATAAVTYDGPFVIDQDETRLVNEARYTGSSGMPQTVRDQSSVDSYGLNDDTQTLISVADPDAHSLAVVVVNENADPADRYEELVVRVNSANRDVAIPAVLGRELFDLVSMEVESTYGAPTVTVQAVIQSIALSVNSDGIVARFRLGPYHPHEFFTIAHPTLGAIQSVGAVAP